MAFEVSSIPVSLYVHLPWCTRKCPYCDFNSYQRSERLPELEYVDALLDDLACDTAYLGGRALHSIFIGGGTPSLFSGASIQRLMDGVRQRVALAEHVEVTLEANPGSAEAGNFAAYRAAGINRLSLGVQSFRAPQLAALGRIHGADDACAAVATARQAGFANLNVDLMYGLPDDSVDGALGDLDTAVALSPEHISWYQLTLEPGTQFGRRPPLLPDDDLIADIADTGGERLAAKHYDRYEVSAYARPGFQARHNLNYWQFGDYLGIGAGAHGKVTQLAGIRRTRKRRNPQSYLQSAASGRFLVESAVVQGPQAVSEFMLNGLRLRHGFDRRLLRTRAGGPPDTIDVPLAEAIDRGWLRVNGNEVIPTPRGYDFLNDLQLLFF